MIIVFIQSCKKRYDASSGYLEKENRLYYAYPRP